FSETILDGCALGGLANRQPAGCVVLPRRVLCTVVLPLGTGFHRCTAAFLSRGALPAGTADHLPFPDRGPRLCEIAQRPPRRVCLGRHRDPSARRRSLHRQWLAGKTCRFLPDICQAPE